MLQDGLELTPGSLVLNSLIENGAALPTTNLRVGRVFFLTVDQGDTKAGAYVYTTAGWAPMGSGPSAPEVVKYDIGLFCGGKVDVPEAVLASFWRHVLCTWRPICQTRLRAAKCHHLPKPRISSASMLWRLAP